MVLGGEDFGSLNFKGDRWLYEYLSGTAAKSCVIIATRVSPTSKEGLGILAKLGIPSNSRVWQLVLQVGHSRLLGR